LERWVQNPLSPEKQKVNNPEFAIDTYSDTLQMSGLPSFPASVIHVIHREYILSHPGIVLKSELLDPDYVNHMETRLIQMFPLTAFSGMMDSADYIINNVIASLPTYTDSVEYIEADTIPNYFSEIQHMNLDSIEQLEWRMFDSLAVMYPSNPAELSQILELDSLLGSNKTEINWCKVYYGMFLTSVTNPWVAFRVWQSGKRANSREFHYYGGNYTDTKSDAYRHITWNMLMRRYTGITVAFVTSAANEFCGNNRCCSKQMDFHNNYVGRQSKYWTFRDITGTNPWAWKKWSANVYDYVQNSSNEYFVGGNIWVDNSSDSEILECTQIKTYRKNIIPKYKYIYIKP
jgi:hypothetical protein